MTMHLSHLKKLKGSKILISSASTEVHFTCLYKFRLEQSFETSLLIQISHYATKIFSDSGHHKLNRVHDTKMNANLNKQT
jgi:hypothetical protein